jgi:hypothetical protein
MSTSNIGMLSTKEISFPYRSGRYTHQTDRREKSEGFLCRRNIFREFLEALQ